MKRERGFSLVEVMLTVFITTSSLVAFSKFQLFNYGFVTEAKQREEATSIGQSVIENFRNYETLTTTAGKLAYADIVTGSSTTSGLNGTYTSSWTITTNNTLNYKSIAVTVSWVRKDNVTSQITLNDIYEMSDPATSGNVYSASTAGAVTLH